MTKTYTMSPGRFWLIATIECLIFGLYTLFLVFIASMLLPFPYITFMWVPTILFGIGIHYTLSHYKPEMSKDTYQRMLLTFVGPLILIPVLAILIEVISGGSFD